MERRTPASIRQLTRSMTARQRSWMLAVLAAGFVIRILLVLSLRGGPYFYDPIIDSESYDTWAQQIATEDFWGDRAFYQDPLYAYALGIFYALFGRDLFWVRLVQCAVGTCGLWMLFEAIRRFLGYRAAMTGLVLGAFYKTFLFYDTAILKDFLGVVSMEAALLCWAAGGRLAWLGFGVAVGLGALVRGNMLLLAFAAAGLLTVRRAWAAAGLTVAGLLLVVVPVTVRNAIIVEEWILTTAQFGPNLYTGNNPENTSGRYQAPSFLARGAPGFEEAGFHAEAERRTGRRLTASEVDIYWRDRALEYIVQNPGVFARVTLKRFLMLLSSYEIPDNYDIYFMSRFSWVLRLPLFTFGLIVAPLAIAGLWLSRRERERFAMLYVFVLTYGLSIVFFFVFARYRLPLVPLLIVFAAYAVVESTAVVRRLPRTIPWGALLVFVGAFVVVNVPLPESIGGHRDAHADHAKLGIYYSRQQRYEEAIREFERAAQLAPDYLEEPDFVWVLATVCESSGRDDDALRYYGMAADLVPGSAKPLHRVGMIHLRKGKHREAVATLGQGLERDPRYGEAYIPLADAYLRLGEPQKALARLMAGAELLPRNWAIRVKQARIYEDLGMWEKALEAANAALWVRPGEPTALRIRDRARAQEGVTDGAGGATGGNTRTAATPGA